MLLKLVVILLVVLLGEWTYGDSVTCRDENNNAVDWYFVYKAPDHPPTSPLNRKKKPVQLKYIYITSKFPTVQWAVSQADVNSSDSCMGKTLSPLLEDEDVLFVAYNDETPDNKISKNRGHTKGVVAANGESGIWLVHSVPKYPHIGSYEFADNGMEFGQSFLCITLNSSQTDLVGTQLAFNEPNIYKYRVPAELAKLYPHIIQATKMQWRTDPPFSNILNLTATDGTVFQSFAKARRFNQELYEDLVATTLHTSLYVETWRHQNQNLPSNCTQKYRVMNVSGVKLPMLTKSFSYLADHSKWAVSVDQNWICIGDINRGQHQLKRGGGTVCLNNPEITEAYRKLVNSVEPCA